MNKRFTRRACRGNAAPAHGFTLLEILVAMAVTLILMGIVVSAFAWITNGVRESRAVMEMENHLRNARHRLVMDLRGTTVRTVPPRSPETGDGYFEYIEGAVGPVTTHYYMESMGGDLDDVIMFTSRSLDEQFLGGISNSEYVSDRAPTAEVAWFLRNNRLYRRVLLIVPGMSRTASNLRIGHTYQFFDLSMRQEGGFLDRNASPRDAGRYEHKQVQLPPEKEGYGGFVPAYVDSNSLGDLTKRENRYAHQPLVFPHESRNWVMSTTSGVGCGQAGLPTKADTAYLSYGTSMTTNPPQPLTWKWTWPFPMYDRVLTNPRSLVQSPLHSGEGVYYVGKDTHNLLVVPNDVRPTGPSSSSTTPPVQQVARGMWQTPYLRSSRTSDVLRNYGGAIDDDLILDDVLSFDVKAWDPGAPVFQVQGNVDASSGGAVDSAVLIPGDVGYLMRYGNSNQGRGALARFISNGSTNTARLVSFGAYVDLNYMVLAGGPDAGYETKLRAHERTQNIPVGSLPRPYFAGPGDAKSQLQGTVPFSVRTDLSYAQWFKDTTHIPCVWDSWSTHYESDGIDNDRDGLIDEGTDGVDNDRIAGIDDPGEAEAPPPYPHPLRGIQIKIRCFERDTKQVREVTIVHEFLPE